MPEHEAQVVVGKAVVVFRLAVCCLRVFRGVLEAWTCGLVFIGGEGEGSEGWRLYVRVRGYWGLYYLISLQVKGLPKVVNFYVFLVELLLQLGVSIFKI